MLLFRPGGFHRIAIVRDSAKPNLTSGTRKNKIKKTIVACMGKNQLGFVEFWDKTGFYGGYMLEVIDYVVIHELSHIKYKNHSRMWRGGRAVECTGLENRQAFGSREFESHPLRQI